MIQFKVAELLSIIHQYSINIDKYYNHMYKHDTWLQIIRLDKLEAAKCFRFLLMNLFLTPFSKTQTLRRLDSIFVLQYIFL